MREIERQLKEIVNELFGIDDFSPEVTVAPEDTGADFASNVAMKLAKEVHMSPRELAEKIAEKVSGFEVSIARPGFLNFISSDEYYVEKLKGLVDDFDKNISLDEYSGQTVICEFSDPNPFKVLHVGHLYTSIVGDAISRLVEFAGGKVVRANFGGDVGMHVAKNLYILKNKREEFYRLPTLAEKAELMAKCYVEGTRAYEDDEKARSEITKINKEIYGIAKRHTEFTVLAQMYWDGRKASYDYFKQFYAKLGLKFDKYYPESRVADKGYAEVMAHPRVYVESDGAIVFRGEDYGLHTRVFINKEGLPTYEAKDVGLLFTKWDDYHFDKSIVITGNEIIDYMKVVLKSVSLYAPELPERTLHLTHGMVKLPGMEKMSSRKGNFLRATDVLDAVASALPDGTDSKVAISATKYAFLKYKMGGDIEFDVKSSVATTGNSGVYLLYSVVRAKKVLSRVASAQPAVAGERRYCLASLARPKGRTPAGSAMPAKELSFALTNEHAMVLVKKVLQYRDVLSEAVGELAPHKVCQYLYELAQEFSRFYENVPVVGSENEKELMALVAVYVKVMEHGLSLLGMEAPEEM